MQLVYFASPMCSWCWGFSPVIQKIKALNKVDNIRLVLTPFRIDTTQPMDDALRNYVLGQWQKVHHTTEQSFDFRFAMPEEFIYNTRLVCLAIKAFNKQLPQQEFEYLHALQQAFYVENKDLTNQAVLIDIAEKFALDTKRFSDDLMSSEVSIALEEDFVLCQQLAVQSYPTLMTEKFGNYSVLVAGYCSYEDLATRVVAQA
ncbi:MAG: DsbA family protein [Gammaproteobacteria bacterium]